MEGNSKLPCNLGFSVLLIGVTVAWWTGANISPLFENAEIRRGQLWRLATSVLPHLDILHLTFNLYWLWVLGTTVERLCGHFRTMLLVLLFAISSGSLDYALEQGGVGLSGLEYGLFGLLYVLSQRDERFKESLDKRTINLFVGWFFTFIFGTGTHLFNVANVAHAVGALLGLLLGYAIVLPMRRSIFVGASPCWFSSGSVQLPSGDLLSISPVMADMKRNNGDTTPSWRTETKKQFAGIAMLSSINRRLLHFGSISESPISAQMTRKLLMPRISVRMSWHLLTPSTLKLLERKPDQTDATVLPSDLW